MEYYISYHRIIDFFKQYQQQSPRLNSFGHGDVIMFSENMSGSTSQYPYMFATPITIIYNENTTQYQFQILFADIVNTDLSNEIDVITDMSIEAKNLIAEIRRGDLQDYMDCIIPATSSTFMERFNDHVGGVQLDLTIEVFDDINACVMYPTPTPTATPSPTPTQTLTSTPTLTPTNSPTNTPTNTPTQTPTLTPTLTPTQTIPIDCRLYNFPASASTAVYTYVDCSGNTQTINLDINTAYSICAKANSINFVSGQIRYGLSLVGLCPPPNTPTPTATQ